MGKKGDCLELIESAPIGVDTLTASVWNWIHHERSRNAIEAVTSATVSTASLSFGGSSGEMSDKRLRVVVAPPNR
jgi:hypothetical protein